VAPTETTVLISGETGTGKELIARALHHTSPRKAHPLVKVNCAALPAHLIESELFGHERGAFTGATARRIGRFEFAQGGTIFLDEIGELPLELQPRLLRVIQEGEFQRVGSSKTLKSDVRVIAATNRHLKEEISAGRFRQDLFYRLSVYPLAMPPLRERTEDIPLLVQAFVQKFSKRLGKQIETIPQRTMHALQQYSWPGNVRELENVIERAVIITPDDILRIELPQEQVLAADVSKTLNEIEREYILQVLESKNWRVSGPKGAAVVLGLNEATLRSRMQKLGIQRP
jgi:transcriptional regulator with GAF, ATPase, and Fis domain